AGYCANPAFMISREGAPFSSTFLVLVIIGCGVASPGVGQEEIAFEAVLYGTNAVPPNNFGLTACGRLWLRGTNLYYRFARFSEPKGPVELRGPAGPRKKRALLYSLRGPKAGGGGLTIFDPAADPHHTPPRPPPPP